MKIAAAAAAEEVSVVAVAAGVGIAAAGIVAVVDAGETEAAAVVAVVGTTGPDTEETLRGREGERFFKKRRQHYQSTFHCLCVDLSLTRHFCYFFEETVDFF
jgi:hypothetical protein